MMASIVCVDLVGCENQSAEKAVICVGTSNVESDRSSANTPLLRHRRSERKVGRGGRT
jgi:hypothetical protein